jgi:glutamate---cysteine ligase / carboxylate-amine ligase
MERLRPHSEELGSVVEFDGLQDILDNGTGAARQALVYEANHDLVEVVREIVEASVPEAAETLGD